MIIKRWPYRVQHPCTARSRSPAGVMHAALMSPGASVIYSRIRRLSRVVASSRIAAPLIRGAAIRDPCRRPAGHLSRHAGPAGTGRCGRADHRVRELNGRRDSCDT